MVRFPRTLFFKEMADEKVCDGGLRRDFDVVSRPPAGGGRSWEVLSSRLPVPIGGGVLPASSDCFGAGGGTIHYRRTNSSLPLLRRLCRARGVWQMWPEATSVWLSANSVPDSVPNRRGDNRLGPGGCFLGWRYDWSDCRLRPPDRSLRRRSSCHPAHSIGELGGVFYNLSPMNYTIFLPISYVLFFSMFFSTELFIY